MVTREKFCLVFFWGPHTESIAKILINEECSFQEYYYYDYYLDGGSSALVIGI